MDWPRPEVLAAARASSSVSQCRSLSRIKRDRSAISCWPNCKSRLSRSGGRRVVANNGGGGVVRHAAIRHFGAVVYRPAQPGAQPSSRTVPTGSLSPERERALKPKHSFKECDKCPDMVVVPAGNFTMGSPATETGRDIDESPQHSVMIAKPFAVASSISRLRSGMRALPSAVAMSTYRRIKVGGAVGGQ